MDTVFMGSPDFALPALNKLAQSELINICAVVTQPDRPRGRGQKMQATPVKKRAVELGLEVYGEKNVNNPEFITKLKTINPQVIIVAAFGQILSSEILNLPEIACLNIHASLLPKYRGAAPIHRAIIDGQKETGITIMYMDEGMDTGDIISQKKVEIKNDDTAGSLHNRLAETGANLMLQTLTEIKQGKMDSIAQDDSEATYADKLKKSDGKIDWTKSATEIYNLVRGLNPWPTAYTFYKGQRLKLWWLEVVKTETQANSAGEIIQANRQGLLVQCGTGVVKIIDLQPAGKQKMNYQDFLNGHQLKIGSRLGEDQ